MDLRSRSRYMLKVSADAVDELRYATRQRATHSTYMSSHPSWALSKRIYDAVGEVIDQIDLAKPDGKQLPAIVIDARLADA